MALSAQSTREDDIRAGRRNRSEKGGETQRYTQTGKRNRKEAGRVSRRRVTELETDWEVKYKRVRVRQQKEEEERKRE